MTNDLEKLREEIARGIADELGDDFDRAYESKSEWINDRGGEPFRDVNMPFKGMYLAAADIALNHPQIADLLRMKAIQVVPSRESAQDERQP